jgi:uncharacterized protein YdcH (DUF465 family)
MGSNKPLLLIHSSMKPLSLAENVNIMLTPQFYTMKKEALPLKYHHQAKKIAPSLFDGLLEEGGEYRYFVFKEGEEWVFIAYDPGKISSFLREKGISPEQVSKLFFAQQALESFTGPVLLGEKEALVVLNDAVVVVPRTALAEELVPLAVDNNFTPSSGVVLEGSSGSLLSDRQTMIVAAVFLVFAVMFFVEGWRYSHELKTGEGEMQRLLEEHPSLQSRIKRENIAAKYQTIDSMERKKREVVKTLAGMIFKGVTFHEFTMNEKGFKARFSCRDAKVAERLGTLAKKENFSVSKEAGSNDLWIEGKL